MQQFAIVQLSGEEASQGGPPRILFSPVCLWHALQDLLRQFKQISKSHKEQDALMGVGGDSCAEI